MSIDLENRAGIPAIIVRSASISPQESIEFKQILQRACASSGSVSVYFEECPILPSTIIGALLQKKEIDKVSINIFAKKTELIDSLKRLRLAEMLGLTQY